MRGAELIRTPSAWHRFPTGLLRRRIGRTRVPVSLGDGIRIMADLDTNLGIRAYRYRSWRQLEPTVAEVRRRLAPGQVFIDGGANVGLFTLYGALAVGAGGRVVAFEPAPGAIRELTENVRLNGFHWVDIAGVALSGQAGLHDFVDLGKASGFSSFAPKQTGGSRISVRTIRLDDAVPDVELVGMVKLDLEGAEVAALRGAPRMLAAGVPFIVEIEEEHLQRQGTTASDVYEMFKSAGYCWRQLPLGPNVLFESGAAR